MSQEVLLGIGGVRALEAMGMRPNVWHMNEGHSSFSLALKGASTDKGGRGDLCRGH